MVLVYGTICLDRIRRVPSLPHKGSYVEAVDEQVFLGGEAVNTALALRVWGNSMELAGNSLGNDDDGQLLERLLSEHGLKVHALVHASARTPVCDIYVTPDGDRTMFGIGFSQMSTFTDPRDFPRHPGEWFTADVNMQETVREAVRVARADGMRIYLMDFTLADDPVDENTYWQSSTDWVGHRGNVQKNVEWVKRFVDARGCFTVLSDGPNGLVAGSPTHRVKAHPPFPCPQLVDSTGAGDMFRAGMLHGLDNGKPVEQCLMFASTAGSLECQYLGANERIPTIDEIETHIAAYPEIADSYR